MPNPPRWASRHPKEAAIVAGLKAKGYSATKIQDWLKSEGHSLSTDTIYDIADEINEPGARERILRKRRAIQRNQTREQRDARNAVERAKRKLQARKEADGAMKTWLNNPEFNPDTGGVG